MGAPPDHHHLPRRHPDRQEVVQILWCPQVHPIGWGAAVPRRDLQDVLQGQHTLHKTSCPYNPESKGVAEEAVKNVMKLLVKCIKEGTDFQTELAVFHNCPRADSCSPGRPHHDQEPPCRGCRHSGGEETGIICRSCRWKRNSRHPFPRSARLAARSNLGKVEQEGSSYTISFAGDRLVRVVVPLKIHPFSRWR